MREYKLSGLKVYQLYTKENLFTTILFYIFCRWRKHKCNLKKRNKLLNGLKKCTCFSADGNLYTKLEMDKNKIHSSK